MNRDDKMILEVERIGNLYYLKISKKFANLANTKHSAHFCHYRMGYVTKQAWFKMYKTEKLSDCEICAKASVRDTVPPFLGIRNSILTPALIQSVNDSPRVVVEVRS